MTNSGITRGTVVWVKCRDTEPHGHIIFGDRPAVVISCEDINNSGALLVVAFMTTKLKRLELRDHVVLQHYDGMQTSCVQLEQLATIDAADIEGIMGQLRPEDMTRINTALKYSLGLD